MTRVKIVCNEFGYLPLNTPILLKFQLGGTYSRLGGTLHTVTLACSNKLVSLSTKGVIIEEGRYLSTNILSSSGGTGIVEISVDGKPDGSILFNFLNSKDVFSKIVYDLLMSELKYVASEVNDEHHPAEYDGNYCMSAAERGLSELLKDTTNFYAVERGTQKRKNIIGFSGKSAIDRGKRFQSLGLTEAFHEFDSYTINHTKKDLIYKAKDQKEAKDKYAEVRYDIVELTPAAKAALTKLFEDDLRNKELGFHVYYFTVTNGFHTLLLIIDKLTNPCDPTYEIWDQHGLSSSHGSFKDIADGIRKQTSWTFANSCLNRFIAGTTKYFDSTKTYLWKMKQK